MVKEYFDIKQGDEFDEGALKYFQMLESFKLFALPNFDGPLGEVEAEGSVYYWWFAYLKKDKEYQALCANKKLARSNSMYKDFGDIFKHESFIEWWSENDRGKKLFEESDTAENKRILFVRSPVSAKDLEDSQYVYLRIPLFLSKRDLLKSFRNILNLFHTRKRGEKGRYSSAKYKIAGLFDVRQLRTTLELYEFREYGPHVPLWRIAQVFDLCPSLTNKSDDELDSHQKNYMSVSAHKRLERAEILIDNVGKGSFPNFTDNRSDLKKDKKARPRPEAKMDWYEYEASKWNNNEE